MEIDPKALEGETLVGFSDFAIVLREVVEGYLRGKGVELTPGHRGRKTPRRSYRWLPRSAVWHSCQLRRGVTSLVGGKPAFDGRTTNH